jgi:hypothetical protein
MSVVAAGPLAAVSALVGLAGVAKVARPDRTAQALGAAGIGLSSTVAQVAGRLIGVAEVGLAVAAIALGSRPVALLVAATYVAFAAFTLRLIARTDGQADCGCFGASHEPATRVHVALNLGAAALAVFAAADPPGSIRAVLAHQPLAGVPFVALVVLCTWLGHACFTLLTDLGDAVHEGGSTAESAR